LASFFLLTPLSSFLPLHFIANTTTTTIATTTITTGKWDDARDLLSAANDMMKLLVPGSEGDGPCLTLLEYMEERNWTAPSDWQGYRPLTSK
jgi:hypothetical protein